MCLGFDAEINVIVKKSTSNVRTCIPCFLCTIFTDQEGIHCPGGLNSTIMRTVLCTFLSRSPMLCLSPTLYENTAKCPPFPAETTYRGGEASYGGELLIWIMSLEYLNMKSVFLLVIIRARHECHCYTYMYPVY